MRARASKSRQAATFAIALLGALLALPSSAGAFQARVPDSFFGINAPELVLRTWTDPVGTEAHLAGIERAGVDWVRADVTWEQVEPVVPVGSVHVYNWTFYDRWVQRLAQHDLTWLPMPSGAPVWARNLDSTLAGCGYRGAPVAGQADNYGAFVQAVVQRYGRNGVYWQQNPTVPYRPITTVELWNEPNWGGFWCPQPEPETYAALASLGASGAHAADPDVTVSVGGLVTTREDIIRYGRAYGMQTDRFLERMLLAVPALRNKLDAVALHLYDADPDVNLSLIGWIRNRMNQLGMSEQQLLITEFGWYTQGDTDWVPEATRAANYRRLVDQLARTDCDIAGLAPYNWLSPEIDPGNAEHWFGIANPNASLKPAGSAYAQEVATYLGSGPDPAPRDTINLCSSSPPDQDGDGVPDETDEYPLDPTRSTGSGEESPPDPDAPVPPPRPARVPQDFFGVYARQMPWEAERRRLYYDSMQEARLGSVRDSILWNHAEPLPPSDPGHVLRWTETDPRVLGLARRGIRVQPTFVQRPAWLTGDQATGNARFASFLAGYARQYGRGGTFWAENGNLDPALAVSDYEIWSNANLPEGAWDGSASAAEYAATYQAARTALHAVDPGARAVIPVLAGGPAGAAADFIRAMVAARPSLGGAIDGVYVQSLQPASTGDVETLAAAVRAALTDTGNADASLRMGVGWYTSGAGAISESVRANLLSATASRLARSNCGIDGFYADAWTMNEANPASLWDWLGIANPVNGTLKPSGVAYSGVAHSYLGYGSSVPPRDIIRSCGSGDPDRDGDGITDPLDDEPLVPQSTDTTAPQTQIDSGPQGASTNPSPSFGFSSNEAGSTFACRLDASAWAPCSSPKAYAALADGAHSFEVRATDAAGNTDQSPAARAFTLDRGAPQVKIHGPKGRKSTARFTLSATDASNLGAFECRLDRKAWVSCKPNHRLTSLSKGRHVLRVRVSDEWGNRGTAAKRWRVRH
jgi:hypothetical protein